MPVPEESVQPRKSFKDKYGNAEKQLRLLINVAKELGSPAGRCYLDHPKTGKRKEASVNIWKARFSH